MSDALADPTPVMHKVCSALICSDIHLSDTNPALTEHFLSWLNAQFQPAAQYPVPQSLIILGDLFDAWVGDDQLEAPDCDESAKALVKLLRDLTAQGIEVMFLHCNRDFLLGTRFEEATGARLLNDPSMIECAGRMIAIGHGDAWCTDDIDYQSFRQQVRQPQWQEQFLRQPLHERRAIAQGLRTQSEHQKSRKSDSIMDVNLQAIDQFMGEIQASTLIHGHTHRPATHRLSDGRERWVLSDWETNNQGALTRGGGLLLDAQGIQTIGIS